ncbi:unnamed protein product, partial [marine sediment metagenome]
NNQFGILKEIQKRKYNLNKAVSFLILAYVIVRYKLLNIKVIATDILVGAIVFTILVFTILSKNIVEFTGRGIFLILVSIFGWLAIRGVHREVEKKRNS